MGILYSTVSEYYDEEKKHIKTKKFYYFGKLNNYKPFAVELIPAITEYYNNGTVKSEHYYSNGKSRDIVICSYPFESIPADRFYDQKQRVEKEVYYNDLTSTMRKEINYAYDDLLNQRYLTINLYSGEDTKNNILESTEIRYNDMLHSVADQPALVTYYPNGLVASEKWYSKGDLFRKNGPVHITYDEQGCVTNEEYSFGNCILSKESIIELKKQFDQIN